MVSYSQETEGTEELLDQLKELFFKVGLRESIEEEMSMREAGFLIAELRGLIGSQMQSDGHVFPEWLPMQEEWESAAILKVSEPVPEP